MTPREHIKKIKFVLQGIATYLPPSIAAIFPEHQSQFSGRGVRAYPGAIQVARSSYSSWMRTVVAARELGIPLFTENTTSVGEIGPGDALGVGFAMLLSGAEQYFAFDVVPTAANYENAAILEALIALFKERAPIPDDDECPKAYPRLRSYEFPADIFTEEKLSVLLSDARLDRIRTALNDFLSGKRSAREDGISVNYYAPWYTSGAIAELKGRLDLVLSFAAMEHVDDIAKTYDALAQIVKSGGYMAHVIDFKSHGTAGTWNGYFAYSRMLWKIIRGRCRYFINRESYSSHRKAIAKNFTVAGDQKYSLQNTLSRTDLAKEFRGISDDDLVTSGVFLVARK